MQIISRKELPIKKKYVYAVAAIISLLILLQTSTNKGGKFMVILGDAVYYFSNYFVWAFLIEYINGFSERSSFINIRKRLLTIFLELFVLVFIHLICTNLIFYGYQILVNGQTTQEAFNSFKPYIVKAFFSRFFEFIIIVALLRFLATYKAIQSQKLQMLSLERDLHETQLLALQSQLNPHFLFNSLHTLNTLIGYDDDKARSMLIKLTHLLRKILKNNDTPNITFKEELEYFKNYLEIEEERFNDRLKVIYEIDINTYDVKVPTLFLQPLIENAFKHGVSLVDGHSEIHLEAKLKGEKLFICLKNTIPEEEFTQVEYSNKIGLKNLEERLSVFFGNDFEFKTSSEKGKYIVTLIIKNIK